MVDRLELKLLLILAIGLVLISVLIIFYLWHYFYVNIFRLSHNEISAYLTDVAPQCKKIADCNLLPGDILIRRYITKRTWLIDKLAHPYFTHSAFYLGDDQLVEAVGTEKNHKDDIQIAVLSKSDWLNYDVNDFVIIRPKDYVDKLDIIKNGFKNIANDPNYIFGFPKEGRKRASCADLIFDQLLAEGIILDFNAPKIITPDYLFWTVKNNPINFELIGFNIER